MTIITQETIERLRKIAETALASGDVKRAFALAKHMDLVVKRLGAGEPLSEDEEAAIEADAGFKLRADTASGDADEAGADEAPRTTAWLEWKEAGAPPAEASPLQWDATRSAQAAASAPLPEAPARASRKWQVLAVAALAIVVLAVWLWPGAPPSSAPDPAAARRDAAQERLEKSRRPQRRWQPNRAPQQASPESSGPQLSLAPLPTVPLPDAADDSAPEPTPAGEDANESEEGERKKTLL
ncbi:MAG: hypothetical protein HYV63_22115 [Candidatus Schekmanbacteria bacterium]|nr:hypothetical protein [Candidatus Schekmanbacteria bacterium]